MYKHLKTEENLITVSAILWRLNDTAENKIIFLCIGIKVFNLNLMVTESDCNYAVSMGLHIFCS